MITYHVYHEKHENFTFCRVKRKYNFKKPHQFNVGGGVTLCGSGTDMFSIHRFEKTIVKSGFKFLLFILYHSTVLILNN
jgi:hypothetical protein